MDDDYKTIVAVSVACVLVAVSGLGGCTFIVDRNGKRYYEVMQQCITAGGTFVPTSGGSSNAACIRAAAP